MRSSNLRTFLGQLTFLGRTTRGLFTGLGVFDGFQVVDFSPGSTLGARIETDRQQFHSSAVVVFTFSNGWAVFADTDDVVTAIVVGTFNLNLTFFTDFNRARLSQISSAPFFNSELRGIASTRHTFVTILEEGFTVIDLLQDVHVVHEFTNVTRTLRIASVVSATAFVGFFDLVATRAAFLSTISSSDSVALGSIADAFVQETRTDAVVVFRNFIDQFSSSQSITDGAFVRHHLSVILVRESSGTLVIDTFAVITGITNLLVKNVGRRLHKFISDLGFVANGAFQSFVTNVFSNIASNIVIDTSDGTVHLTITRFADIVVGIEFLAEFDVVT